MLVHEIALKIIEFLFMVLIYTSVAIVLITISTFFFGVAYVVLKEFFPKFYKLLRRLIIKP